MNKNGNQQPTEMYRRTTSTAVRMKKNEEE
jgi:hypothetical protein